MSEHCAYIYSGTFEHCEDLVTLSKDLSIGLCFIPDGLGTVQIDIAFYERSVTYRHNFGTLGTFSNVVECREQSNQKNNLYRAITEFAEVNADIARSLLKSIRPLLR